MVIVLPDDIRQASVLFVSLRGKLLLPSLIHCLLHRHSF